MIRHLRHNEIDKVKWDVALSKCHQSLLYAQSWFLDIVSPNWCALVRGDYEELMPLPLKSKWGFKYLVQPNFTAQLGVFSTKNEFIDVVDWVKVLRKNYRRYDINLNTFNSLLKADQMPVLNCELKLDRTYEDLRSDYTKSHKRNLKKAKQPEIVEISIKEFLSFKMQELNGVSATQYEKLPILYDAFANRNIPILALATGESDLISAAVFVYFENWIVCFGGASTPKGKEKRAMFALMDHVIRKHQNSDLILDFRGGQMKGTRDFFHGFGAEIKTYFRVKRRI